MPKYPFIWSEFWAWRNALPMTASEIKNQRPLTLDDFAKKLPLSRDYRNKITVLTT